MKFVYYKKDRLSQFTKSCTFARHTVSWHTKPTLQKSLPCANAQATLCGWTQTYIVDDRGEGRTYNRGFAKMGADVSRVSTFVFQFCFISSLTLLI